MRSFTEVVFDDIVQGSTSTYSEPRFDALLASADAFALQVVVNQLSAGSPTVTVAIEHGADGRSFAGKSATPEINRATLDPSNPNVLVASDDGSTPSAGAVRVRVQLESGGTARVRILSRQACQTFSPCNGVTRISGTRCTGSA